MTGDLIYEMLSKMTPEERKKYSWTGQAYYGYAKDCLVRLIETKSAAPGFYDDLLNDEKSIMEALDLAVEDEEANDYYSSAFEEALWHQLEDLMERYVDMKTRKYIRRDDYLEEKEMKEEEQKKENTFPKPDPDDIQCDDPMDCEDVEFTIKCKMPVLWAHALVNMLFAMADPDFKSGEGIWDFGIGGQGDLPWGFDFEIESKDGKFDPKPMFPKWYSLDSEEPRLIFDPEFLSDYACNRGNDVRWMKKILADPETPERQKRVIQWIFDRGFDKDWLREGLKHAVLPQRVDELEQIEWERKEKETV
jgi:hypothetical protein